MSQITITHESNTFKTLFELAIVGVCAWAFFTYLAPLLGLTVLALGGISYTALLVFLLRKKAVSKGVGKTRLEFIRAVSFAIYEEFMEFTKKVKVQKEDMDDDLAFKIYSGSMLFLLTLVSLLLVVILFFALNPVYQHVWVVSASGVATVLFHTYLCFMLLKILLFLRVNTAKKVTELTFARALFFRTGYAVSSVYIISLFLIKFGIVG